MMLMLVLEQCAKPLRPCIGRRIRRTPNYGFDVVENPLPVPI